MPKKLSLAQNELIKSLVMDASLSISEIASMASCSIAAVARIKTMLSRGNGEIPPNLKRCKRELAIKQISKSNGDLRSPTKIARNAGVSVSLVKKIISDLNIEKRTRKPKPVKTPKDDKAENSLIADRISTFLVWQERQRNKLRRSHDFNGEYAP